jgi:hypothetical protein
MSDIKFAEFPKMARLSREAIITEKIDGTNAQILITPEGEIRAGSRNRWITPQSDNYGFASWVEAHKEELLQLGPGRHFGEWWGAGIQRRYDLKEKRLSLFNVTRWCLHGEEPQQIPTGNPLVEKFQDVLPPCVGLVPILYRGIFSTEIVDSVLSDLAEAGSVAAPGFRNPEGVVVFHTAGQVGFKKTLENDGIPKSLVKP